MNAIIAAICELIDAEKNTRPRRRDDVVVAQFKRVDRRLLFSVFAMLTAVGTNAAIAIIRLSTPKSGPLEAATSKFYELIQDAALMLLPLTVVIFVVMLIRAWRFKPDVDD